MYYLIRITGIIIALTLLLTAFVRPAQAGGAVSVATDATEQPEDTGLVCLALVGGVAILAGGVLMGMMRRLTP